jgi:AcrR family transcriptional regulator
VKENIARIPDKLKERLYPAVLALFSDKDFHRVNIREISKQTGVSSGTIYKYFSSKEDLIFTILDEKIAEIGEAITLHIVGLEEIKEVLRKVFWVTMDFYDKNPGVAVTAFITVPTRCWMKEKSYRRGVEHATLRAPLAKARQAGAIDPAISNRQIVDLYYMFCYRQIHRWYYFGMKRKLVDTIPEFFELFWKAVRP